MGARTGKALYPRAAGTRQAGVWREFAASASAPASGAKLSLFGASIFPYHAQTPAQPPCSPSLAAVDTHILPALALAAYFLDSLLHRPA